MPATVYTYTAKARDKGDPLHETSPSEAKSATTASLPSLPPPAAHWMLNETGGTTVSDSSGNGNTGTLTGFADPDAAWMEGRYGNCLTVNGSGYMLAPSSPSIDFADEDMTVCLWLKAPTTIAAGTQQEILIKGTIAAPGSGKRYEFYRKNDGTNDRFRFAIDDDVVKSELSVPASTVCTGGWVHIAAVRDTTANEIRFYVNGILAATITDSTGSISQTEPLTISDPANVLTASVDDVRIYRIALTADQIYAALLNN
jgi:hypothetical protein